MSWVILFVSLGLLVIVWKRKKGAPWWLKTALVLMFGASLADTALGGWLSGIILSVLGLLPGPTTAIAGGLGLILTVIVIYGLVDKSADKPEMICLAVLPMVFLAAAGPFAAAGSSLFGSIGDVGQATISRVVGG